MICYRDMTFCPFWESCTEGKECHRALTDKVREQAVIWWGNQDTPISEYVNKPECFNHVE